MEFTKLFSITSSEPWIQEIEAKALYNEPVVDENGNYNFVYCCINLDTHWCYVGKQTCKDPYDQEYVGSSCSDHYWRSRQIHPYKKLFLGYCETEDAAYELEAKIVTKEFIDKYSENGIFNLKVGGYGGIILSPELLELRNKTISDTLTGRSLSDEHRQAISDANYKRFKDPNECKKLSEVHKKRYEDSNERKKTSEALMRYYEDPNARKKISDAMNRPEIHQAILNAAKKRWEDPNEHKKHSDAQNKRYEDPNERKKISDTLTGVPQSEAHIRNSQAGVCMSCIKKSLAINQDPTWDEFVTNLPTGNGTRPISTILLYLDNLRQRLDWIPVMERLFSSQGY